MSPASIQILGFISYCSTVQGRMAGANTIVYEFGRGQHIYESLWSPLTDKTHKIMWEDNKCDKYAVND